MQFPIVFLKFMDFLKNNAMQLIYISTCSKYDLLRVKYSCIYQVMV